MDAGELIVLALQGKPMNTPAERVARYRAAARWLRQSGLEGSNEAADLADHSAAEIEGATQRAAAEVAKAAEEGALAAVDAPLQLDMEKAEIEAGPEGEVGR